MKTIVDPNETLSLGLQAIRLQFQVPETFPSDVLAAADIAAKRVPTEHVDRTSVPFVTLDPATSTDLDQAFAIEASGADLLLHYAIADVCWFVDDGGVIDAEAWRRGTTRYLPDGKAGLYPRILSENVASLLPDGPRPAVIFTVRVASDGSVTLDGVERAIILSRAKLAYDSVCADQLPDRFEDLAGRIQAAEGRRGASRIDPPEQEVSKDDNGRFTLSFRPRLLSEVRNAAMSLATNLAVADALLANHTGLFRVMAEPDERAISRLRHSATAFGLAWPDAMSLTQFETTLSASIANQAAFMLAIRRAGMGASYVPYQPGIVPWHTAMAASYAHATAPLRRLADRYVVRAALAVANGQSVPDFVTNAFAKLPAVMAAADMRAGQIERAVIDLAEASMLRGMEGTLIPAVVTDVNERAVRIQLRDMPVVVTISPTSVIPGDSIVVKLTSVDVDARKASFALALS